MKIIRFLLLFPFMWQVSYNMVITPKEERHNLLQPTIAAACETVKHVEDISSMEQNKLCNDINSLSFRNKLLIRETERETQLLPKEKVEIFQKILELSISTQSYIQKLEENHTLTLKDKNELIYAKKEIADKQIKSMIKKYASAKLEEIFFSKIRSKIRDMTLLDIFYFGRGIPAGEAWMDEDVLKKIKLDFIACTKLTGELIPSDAISSDYIYNGFTAEFSNIGFYKLAEEIRKKMVYLSIIQNEIGSVPTYYNFIENTEIEWKKTIDLELVNKFIQLYIGDCLSRTNVDLSAYREKENKKQFLNYFKTSSITHEEKHMRSFLATSVIQGALRAALLSDLLQNETYRQKIKNAKELILYLFPLLTLEEQEKLRTFLSFGIVASQEIYFQNNKKVQALEQFGKEVEKIITESLKNINKSTKRIYWNTKIAIASLVLGSLVYTAIWLKKNQDMFERYPGLSKLLPFLYQPSLSKSQTFFQKLFRQKDSMPPGLLLFF